MTNPRLTADGQRPTASVIAVKIMDEYTVLMHDRNHGCSITNGAEKICRFVHDQLLARVPYENIRWIYRDTMCLVDEIVTDGVRVSFQSVPPDDEQVSRAIEVVKSVACLK